VSALRGRRFAGGTFVITVGAMSHEVEHRTLSRYLEDHQLKHTKQREAILEIFLGVRVTSPARTCISACATCTRRSGTRPSTAR
jgi:hypothetical protein